MCGIAGVLFPNGETVPDDLVQSMGSTQHHRGPDNFSTYVHENVGLAHNRLSIMDLSEAGNQPFRNDRYALVFNGEIYNHRELARRLEADGIALSGTSDTAALFEYLVQYGVEATLKSLRGMFAFAFVDLKSRTAFLCRDRFGIKPLVWKYASGRMYWASEIKAIDRVSVLQVNTMRVLNSAVAGVENSSYLTPFQDVEMVAPGTYLCCRAGEPPTRHHYYRLTDDVDESYYRELDRIPASEVVSQFESILNESVNSLLMSDAPMGSFVSGGIDSSLVTHLAAEHESDLSLFTANIVGAFSEFSEAKHLSETVGQRLFEARFTPEMFLSGWTQATWHAEIPIIAHVNSVPFARLAGLARQEDVKAVLTGEGSDELFLGYPKLLSRRWKKYAALPLDMIVKLYGLVPKLKSYIVPEGGKSVDSFLVRYVRHFEREMVADESEAAFPFLDPKSATEHYLTIDYFRSHLLKLLHRNDRMGMVNSIESRFPFLDEPVVRFGLNLPVKYKIGRTWRPYNLKHPFAVDKWIVREVAKRRLPRTLATKPKFGFPIFGHAHLNISKGFFSNGYLADAVGMTSSVEDYLLNRSNPYHVGKLASMEVFGRLFALKDTQEQVGEHLLRHVSMRTSDGSAVAESRTDSVNTSPLLQPSTVVTATKTN